MPDRPVFYFTRFLTGYRIPVLERLNARLDGRLIACSGQPPNASSLSYLVDREENTFRQMVLRNRWVGGEAIHAQPFREVFRRFGDPAAILCEESPRSVSLPLLLRYARSRGAGRLLWGHFSSLNRAFDPRRHLHDRYRLALARQVEACVCYTEGVADHLRPYLPDEKLFVARNTIEFQHQRGNVNAGAPESAKNYHWHDNLGSTGLDCYRAVVKSAFEVFCPGIYDDPPVRKCVADIRDLEPTR